MSRKSNNVGLFHIGTFDKDGLECSGTIGWAVTYNNADNGNSFSTCTWSGQRQLVDNLPVISTTWLLTVDVTKTSGKWDTTYTNQDFFRRALPEDEKIRATLIARNFKEYV